METAGIYGLSSVLGHKAISLNLIMANRPKGEFSKNYELKMNELILSVLHNL
jgi:uridine phosphorylase